METTTKRGDLTLLDHPVARELLAAAIPARLAYVARDGTPRVVPMQFHWTGSAIVLSCWPDDPKVDALRRRPAVAITIDTADPPTRALQIRGRASLSLIEGPSREMSAAAERYLGPEGARAWLAQAADLSPQTVRIAVMPEWVDVVDFETRLPGGMERLLGRRGATSTAPG